MKTTASEELTVACPLCGVGVGRQCIRPYGETSSHEERTVDLLLSRAGDDGGLSGNELWNALMAETARMPDGRRRAWERQYLPQVRRICYGA